MTVATVLPPRIITIAPASVARRDLYARMADSAYLDYLDAQRDYTDAVTRPGEDGWIDRVRSASAAKASAVEVMRIILELGGFRHRPADAADTVLDGIAWYEKHLLGRP